MSGTVALRVREMRPGELASSDRRLAPDHPFLQTGSWRAFAAADARQEVRVVASVDPRQRVEAGQVGAIGFIDTDEDTRVPAVAAALSAALAAAEAWLAERGVVVVRCPVQFSTWYGHRAMTGGFPQEGGPPAFPMEPANDPGLADTLTASGFGVAHAAASYRVSADRWIEGVQRGEVLMRADGFRDRPIRLDRLDDELRTVYAIASAAFRRGWGFSDIALGEFLSIYRPLMSMVDPDLVRIAESPDGKPVGFIFAFADPTERPGQPDARFIAKSVAVLPEVRRMTPGIGTGLAVTVHRLAAARGYPVAIHACTADDAYTQRISARWGKRFRTYATFEKVLR